MYLKQSMKRAVAIVLVLASLVGLSACSTEDIYSMIGISTGITAGQTLSGSKWINSDIEGSIDENTQLNLKDDFHTTVNREWLLENEATGEEVLGFSAELADTLSENKLRLLDPDAQYEPDTNIMRSEALEHLRQLILDMAELARNEEKRNELGVEPLRPYLEAIEQIDSLEEMTQYLINAEGQNLSGENFFNFYVDIPKNSRDFYTVHIFYPQHFLFGDTFQYNTIDSNAYNSYMKSKEALEYVLGELGYSEEQIIKLLKTCFNFEMKFTGVLPYTSELDDRYYQRGNRIYTLEEIQDLQKNFPLDQLLEAAGVAQSETFRVYEPAFLSFMGSFYKEKNLDTLKAYLTVHAVLSALPYLNDKCEQLSMELENYKYIPADPDPFSIDEKVTDKLSEQELEQVAILNDYIIPLLKEPYQLLYIGSYANSEAKQEVLDILEDIRAYFIELLKVTDWMGEETRAHAVEKAEKMVFRVMYPDNLPDYSNLNYSGYDEGGNLLYAVAQIRRRNNEANVENINQPVQRSDWDLTDLPTLAINAAYEPEQNRISILSGILAGDIAYNVDQPIEYNYAKLGVILGHEFSHAFDTMGYKYNAEGLAYGWWTNEDEVAFRNRSDKLVNYYNRINAMPGQATGYNGGLVQTEAIADMGAVKCALALAEEIPGFDYDLFFRSYADQWKQQTSYSNVLMLAADVHPLGFLRTNATLQQFDKFYETYGIEPGDGMYLAPEDRVMVW